MSQSAAPTSPKATIAAATAPYSPIRPPSPRVLATKRPAAPSSPCTPPAATTGASVPDAFSTPPRPPAYARGAANIAAAPYSPASPCPPNLRPAGGGRGLFGSPAHEGKSLPLTASPQTHRFAQPFPRSEYQRLMRPPASRRAAKPTLASLTNQQWAALARKAAAGHSQRTQAGTPYFSADTQRSDRAARRFFGSLDMWNPGYDRVLSRPRVVFNFAVNAAGATGEPMSPRPRNVLVSICGGMHNALATMVRDANANHRQACRSNGQPVRYNFVATGAPPEGFVRAVRSLADEQAGELAEDRRTCAEIPMHYALMKARWSKVAMSVVSYEGRQAQNLREGAQLRLGKDIINLARCGKSCAPLLEASTAMSALPLSPALRGVMEKSPGAPLPISPDGLVQGREARPSPRGRGPQGELRRGKLAPRTLNLMAKLAEGERTPLAEANPPIPIAPAEANQDGTQPEPRGKKRPRPQEAAALAGPEGRPSKRAKPAHPHPIRPRDQRPNRVRHASSRTGLATAEAKQRRRARPAARPAPDLAGARRLLGGALRGLLGRR